MSRFVYRGDRRRAISFPVGGIGAGCVGLSGSGRLIDWEIFNRPNKLSLNGFSHFGVKAERAGRVLDARVLQADALTGFQGEEQFFGHGLNRHCLGGVPHFRDCAFEGEFPFARVAFEDDSFPGEVSLDAFNPFIPMDEDASSLPAAFYTICVRNDTEIETDYMAEMSVNNPLGERHGNAPLAAGRARGIALEGVGQDAASPAYGKIAFATEEREETSVQLYWYRGMLFDNLNVFWRDFLNPGALRGRTYEPDAGYAGEDVATLAVRFRLAPGAQRRVRFLLCWYFPNRTNDWTSDRPSPMNDHVPEKKIWKNDYATKFRDVEQVADYCLTHWSDLEARTRRFHDLLFASSLPEAVLDAVSANLSVLKSPTCLRLEDGSLYGFEGSSRQVGSCEGSCSHVWNYAFALPFLFPRLERSMRTLDYTYNQRPDGGMSFRLQLPLGSERSSFRPCVDGQMGGVVKTYREWRISGDDRWLRGLWPAVKRSLEFAWAETNEDRWDPDRGGVIAGRQHHTLDMELWGPNAWLTGMYLAALKAGAEMARAMGEPEAAARYEQIRKSGADYVDRALFRNGYYIQRIDLDDREQLTPYLNGTTLFGPSTERAYWDAEAAQIKYQIGEGCIVDQVLGQWMADLCGLGDLLNPEHVGEALASIWRNNFKERLRGAFNPCRVFALDDEAGLTICAWPEGAQKPEIPIPYAQECMTGFEYQAAAHMIGRGLKAEGLRVVRAVRDRYDGARRNPWNEMECGSNYARSMASYALLLMYSGFRYDARTGEIGFAPVVAGGRWFFFWALCRAWGSVERSETGYALCVAEGAQRISRLVLPDAHLAKRALWEERQIAFDAQDGAIVFKSAIEMSAGQKLTVLLCDE